MNSVRKLIGSQYSCLCKLQTHGHIFIINLLIFLANLTRFLRPELHPIPVKDEVWHTICVDYIGPLPETQKGNKYIMTVSCLFSKWPEATALPYKTATGVAEFLFLCFTRHGSCKVNISDQGRDFVIHVKNISTFILS